MITDGWQSSYPRATAGLYTHERVLGLEPLKMLVAEVKNQLLLPGVMHHADLGEISGLDEDS